MEKHVSDVGILHIGLGLLGILFACLTLLVTIGPGIISQDQTALGILITIGTAIAAILTILSLPGIVGGFGILRYKSWARYLVMILSVISLVNVPIGTAVGIYSLWTLIQDETEALFSPITTDEA
jgi:hypothetical protein